MSGVVLVHDGIDREITVDERSVHHHERAGWRRKELAAVSEPVSLVHPDRAPSGEQSTEQE